MKKPKPALTVDVVQRMAPGGIETLVLELVRNGSDADLIFSLDGSADQLIKRWSALDAERRRLLAFDREPDFHPILIAQLAAQFRRLKPQTVIVHHIGPLIYAGLAARLARVHQLVHVEHDIWQYQRPRRRLIMAAFARFLRPHHVAVSQQAANALREIFPGAVVSVIPPGIDTERFKPRDWAAARSRLGFDAAWLVVGSAGRLEPVKGHETLIGALLEMTEPIHIAIAGDGPEKERLKVRAREHGVEDRLHLLGHRDDLEEVLPAFDVFCLPSLAEDHAACWKPRPVVCLSLPATLARSRKRSVPVPVASYRLLIPRHWLVRCASVSRGPLRAPRHVVSSRTDFPGPEHSSLTAT
jgi:glycosyltransferase involved in cell wall biosynthesis